MSGNEHLSRKEVLPLLKIESIKLSPGADMGVLTAEAARILKVREKELQSLRVLRRSVDAREEARRRPSPPPLSPQTPHPIQPPETRQVKSEAPSQEEPVETQSSNVTWCPGRDPGTERLHSALDKTQGV